MAKAWLHKSISKEIEVMGAKIKVRNLRFGDTRHAVSQSVEMDPMTNSSKMDATLMGVLRTISAIQSWDVTDEEDKVLPITLDTFDNILAEEFVSALIDAVSKEIDGGMNEQEKKH